MSQSQVHDHTNGKCGWPNCKEPTSESKIICGHCKGLYYCSDSCKMKDYPNHRTECQEIWSASASTLASNDKTPFKVEEPIATPKPYSPKDYYEIYAIMQVSVWKLSYHIKVDLTPNFNDSMRLVPPPPPLSN